MKLSEKKAIALLRKYSKSEEDFKGILSHSRDVMKIAVDIAKNVKEVDLDFVKTAALLHDIGRTGFAPGSKNALRHGIFGGEILRKEGLPEYALVCERHLGAGISKEDIIEQGLDLPLRDYLPVSKEEKIIAHADNLIIKYRRATVDEAVERFSKELGKKAGEKVRKLAKEVEGMKAGKFHH
jgi:uncharacterized protein